MSESGVGRFYLGEWITKYTVQDEETVVITSPALEITSEITVMFYWQMEFALNGHLVGNVKHKQWDKGMKLSVKHW